MMVNHIHDIQNKQALMHLLRCWKNH
jgi:hypothetical protein